MYTPFFLGTQPLRLGIGRGVSILLFFCFFLFLWLGNGSNVPLFFFLGTRLLGLRIGPVSGVQMVS